MKVLTSIVILGILIILNCDIIKFEWRNKILPKLYFIPIIPTLKKKLTSLVVQNLRLNLNT